MFLKLAFVLITCAGPAALAQECQPWLSTDMVNNSKFTDHTGFELLKDIFSSGSPPSGYKTSKAGKEQSFALEGHYVDRNNGNEWGRMYGSKAVIQNEKGEMFTVQRYMLLGLTGQVLSSAEADLNGDLVISDSCSHQVGKMLISNMNSNSFQVQTGNQTFDVDYQQVIEKNTFGHRISGSDYVITIPMSNSGQTIPIYASITPTGQHVHHNYMQAAETHDWPKSISPAISPMVVAFVHRSLSGH